MLDKTRKIIYIISGTLTIISLVFMLMHKVGLCASVNPPSVASSIYPLPVGVGYGYDSNTFLFSDSVFDSIITKIQTDSSSSYLFNDSTYGIYLITLNEIDISNDRVTVNVYGWKAGRVTFSIDSSNNYQLFSSGSGADYYLWRCVYNISSGSVSMSYQGTYPYNFTPYGNNRPFSDTPTGNGYVFNYNQDFYGYPLYADFSLVDQNGNLIFYVPSDSDSNFIEGEVTSLPSFDSLTSNPDSNDDSVTLFGKLKGWLSTISGNIQKGFKNIEDNLKSFFQPYFDNFKAFFDILENPEDFLFCSQERQQELLQSSQVYQDVQSLQGIGNNIFGVLGATASEHVYWTFDFSDTVLDSCGVVQIDFDWYESIRNYVVPLFMAFFYVGMLLLIIRKIPGIISGASSNSDDK